MLSLGAKTHSTKLTEEFNFDDFYKKQYSRAVILFAITPRDDLRIFTPSTEIEPAPGWTIISLMLPKEDKENSMESDNNNSD